jgi:hypothetical protein
MVGSGVDSIRGGCEGTAVLTALGSVGSIPGLDVGDRGGTARAVAVDDASGALSVVAAGVRSSRVGVTTTLL